MIGFCGHYEMPSVFPILCDNTDKTQGADLAVHIKSHEGTFYGVLYLVSSD